MCIIGFSKIVITGADEKFVIIGKESFLNAGLIAREFPRYRITGFDFGEEIFIEKN